MNAPAAPAAPVDAANPLLADWTGPYGMAPFAEVRAEQFAPAFEVAMSRHLAEIDAIGGAGDAPTFENTVAALDRSPHADERGQIDLLAREAATLGAWLMHYSTDYVFDGSGSTPWTEDSPTGPLSVYGATKLEGEEAIRASGCRHLIFRTSWVYAARGGNFAKTMLKLAKERDRLTVIDDQIGSPTGADLLADLSAHALRAAMARPDLAGTYHAVASGETSWHGYAKHVIEFARAAGQPIKVAPENLVAVPTSAFPTPAKRPGNSRMNTHKLQHTFGLALPRWQNGVDRMLTEVSERSDSKLAKLS